MENTAPRTMREVFKNLEVNISNNSILFLAVIYITTPPALFGEDVQAFIFLLGKVQRLSLFVDHFILPGSLQFMDIDRLAPFGYSRKVHLMGHPLFQ